MPRMDPRERSNGCNRSTSAHPCYAASLRESCLCAAVQYAVRSNPMAFDLDHCSRCRKSSGSAFKAELIFEAAEFEWVSGGSLVKPYEAPVRKEPPGYRRTFCTVCGG